MEDTVESVPLPNLPEGPILLAGTRNGSTGVFTVVGTLLDGAIDPFPTDDDVPGFRDHYAATLLPPGSELVLFAEGVRVGRMTVTGAGTDIGVCVSRPSVEGVVEMIPTASEARRLMALADPAAAGRPFEAYRVPGYDRATATNNLGAGGIRASGAPWPPSLVESRADMTPFALSGEESTNVAVSFLFADQLAAEPPRQRNAYSLFVIGASVDQGYRADYVRYRRADGPGGKGAARYFGHLDWDGDGSDDVLLEIFGEESRWFAALERQGGQWVETFEDPCGQPR